MIHIDNYLITNIYIILRITGFLDFLHDRLNPFRIYMYIAAKIMKFVCAQFFCILCNNGMKQAPNGEIFLSVFIV
jgi:hypothetical protein